MRTLTQIVERALIILSERGNRSEYARDCLRGYQLWSGADLKGKAARYGASYAAQRSAAASALRAAGGAIVAVEHGLRLSAVSVGQDDYGNAIYATQRGVYVAATGKNLCAI